MITKQSYQKSCATCEYWTGVRELQSNKISVHADDQKTYKCIEKRECKAGSTCSKYKKWGVMKQ